LQVKRQLLFLAVARPQARMACVHRSRFFDPTTALLEVWSTFRKTKSGLPVERLFAVH
jgi:hypothetical protein